MKKYLNCSIGSGNGYGIIYDIHSISDKPLHTLINKEDIDGIDCLLIDGEPDQFSIEIIYIENKKEELK